MNTRTITGNKDLGENLKVRRKQLKVTQKKLASYCNLSHNGISRIEIGDSDVKLSTLIKMSKILGFKISIEFE